MPEKVGGGGGVGGDGGDGGKYVGNVNVLIVMIGT